MSNKGAVAPSGGAAVPQLPGEGGAAAPGVGWEESESRRCIAQEHDARTAWRPLLAGDARPAREEVPVAGYDAWIVRGLFDEAEVRRLVAAAEAEGFGKTNYAPRYRGNLRLITWDQSLTDATWERLRHFVPATREHLGEVWEAAGLNDCWRIAKYHPGDQFGRHCDACVDLHAKGLLSLYTVNVYMSGGHEGGATRFYSNTEFVDDEQLGKQSVRKLDFAVAPEPGLAVLFRQPPGAELYHDGEQLRSGVKYLFRTDVMYRRAGGAAG